MRHFSIVFLGPLALFTGCLEQHLDSTQAADPPNILLILTDDQGYPTLGSYGSDIVAMPSLDQRAEELQNRLHEWVEEIRVDLPSENEHYTLG